MSIFKIVTFTFLLANTSVVANDNLMQEIELYKQGCEANHMSACYMLSSMFKNGIGVAKNNKEAIYYLGRACDLGGGKLVCDDYQSLINKE